MRVKKINTELGLDETVGEWNSHNDRWSRRAKHQLSHADLINAKEIVKLPVFEKNEAVLYQGKEVIVQVANGPNDTSGVIVEGNLKMIHRSKLAKLDEGVLGGMTGLNPINRLMQLAGLESGPSILKPGLVEDENNDEPQKEVKYKELKCDNCGAYCGMMGDVPDGCHITAQCEECGD
jgi:hypothetical protein